MRGHPHLSPFTRLNSLPLPAAQSPLDRTFSPSQTGSVSCYPRGDLSMGKKGDSSRASIYQDDWQIFFHFFLSFLIS